MSANARVLFGLIPLLEQHENSAFTISYKLEFVVVAPILLNYTTGIISVQRIFIQCHYSKREDNNLCMHVNK